MIPSRGRAKLPGVVRPVARSLHRKARETPLF
jgi:hypothetical protein